MLTMHSERRSAIGSGIRGQLPNMGSWCINVHTGRAIKPALFKALAWAEYLEAHARRAYASVTNAQAEGARALLRRIRKGDIADDAGKPLDAFAARDVYRRGWSHLGTPDAFYEAAKMLCDFDYLREEVTASGPKGGAPKQAYRVNPKARTA